MSDREDDPEDQLPEDDDSFSDSEASGRSYDSEGAAGGKTGLEDSDDDDDDADDDADNDSVNSADSRSDEDGAPGDEERGVQEAVEKDGGGEDSASDVSASNLASSKLKKIKKKSMKSKKEKKEKKKRRHSEDSKPKKKRKKSRFIQDLVEVGSDESDDEIEAEVEEEELSADALRAQALVDERNRNRNKFLDADANEVARRFEEQAAQDRILKERLFSGGGGVFRKVDVGQQSLLPTVKDAQIYSVACKTGEEKTLVRSILLKQMTAHAKGEPLRLKSAFCTSSKGYIYLEALAEPLAREAIQGLRGIFFSKFFKVPVREMTSLLSVKVQKRPLKEGQYVRLRRGEMKGDLAKILRLLEGGSKAVIQVVPRPDYDKEKKAVGSGVTARAVPSLFNPEEAAKKSEVVRRRMPALQEQMHLWNNNFYRDGFLIKEVAVSTYIDSENIKPSMEEMALFRERRQPSLEYDDGDVDESEAYGSGSSKTLLDDIIEMQSSEVVTKVVPFVIGDVVQVVSGELRNLKGRVVSVDEAAQLVKVSPMHSDTKTDFFIEASNLVKNINPGQHVKVVDGSCSGQTGKVVCVMSVDGTHVATVLTDGVNTEISVNVSHLQVTNEVTTGLSNLMGYELYDLVLMNANETAVVVYVGAEMLTVINQAGLVKRVLPMDLKGKKNSMSQRTTAFDASHNNVNVGDSVKVTEGSQRNKSGTIQHIFKSVLWLHSTSHLKDSGIFVVRSRSCVLVGTKARSAMQSYSSNTSSATSSGPVARGTSSGGARGAFKNHKDPDIGKTIVITSGQYKGYDANVIAATETHFEVELLAKLKKISIERSKTQVVGDEFGSLTADGKRPAGVVSIQNAQATPFMQGQTPSYLGQTPMHNMGSETPMVGTPYGSTPRGGDTPGHSDEFDPWKITPTAYPPAAPSAAVPSPWNGSEVSGYSGASGWAMGNDRYSPYSLGSASPAQSASSAPAKTGGSIDFSSWKKDFVVTFTAGAHLGKLGVLQQAVQKDGSFYVTQMDSKGQLMSGSIKVHYSEMALADPRNGSQVIVVAGNKTGRTGAVRRVVNNDVFLENKEMFKIFNLAWVIPSEEDT